MNIAFFTHYTDLYGANRSLISLIDGLKTAGHKIIVFAPWDGKIVQYLKSQNIDCYVVNFTSIVTETAKSENEIIERINNNIEAANEVIKICEKYSIDLYYSNSSVIDIGLLVAKKQNKPHIWHFREYGELDYKVNTDIGNKLFNKLKIASDGIVFISNSVQNFHHIKEINFKTIYNGVITYSDLQILKKYSKNYQLIRKFVIIGRIQSNKGQDVAVNAFSQVVKKYPDAKLTIVGGGGVKWLTNIINRLGINGNVIFAGEVLNPFEILSESDCCLMCSLNEAMGRVTVEAMACGVPVIGNNSGGTAEIIQNEYNGFLYNNSTESLAAKMIEVIENPQFASIVAQNGIRTAEKLFTIDKYVASVNNYIAEIFEYNQIENKKFKFNENEFNESEIKYAELYFNYINNNLKNNMENSSKILKNDNKILESVNSTVNLPFIDKSRQYWDVKDLYTAMFTRIYVDPNLDNKSMDEKIKAWDKSAESSANKILQGIPFTNSWKALEIGCGIGRIIKPLREKLAIVDGVDIAPSMIDFANEYLVYPQNNGRVLVNNGYDLADLNDNDYDLVYSMIVFQHIRSASVVKSYFKEIKRVLKDNGYLRIQVFDDTKPGRGKFDEEAMYGIDYGLMGNGYKPEEFKNLLLEQGFKIENFEYNSPWIWATCTKDNIIPKANKEILVSAIVSTYNSEKYIKYCLDNLINQTLYKKGLLEIVVVNSASQQNEDFIIKEYIQKYTNINYLKTDKRETLYKAWNRGIELAKGKYITNANTDDSHRYDALEIMATELERNNSFDLVYGNTKITETELQMFDDCHDFRPLINIEYSSVDTLLHFQFGPQPMWRKSLHTKIGFFDEKLTAVGDYDFNIRFALANCKAKYISEHLGIFYDNANSITNSFTKQKEEKSQLLRKYRTYENILKLYQNAGYEISTKEQQAIIFDNQAHKAVAFHVAGDSKKRSDIDYASFCSQVAEQLKDGNKLKVAIIAQANNFEFMLNIIPAFQKVFNLRIINSKDQNDLANSYNWADVIWLEWFDTIAKQIADSPKRCRIIARVHAYEVFKPLVMNMNYTHIDTLIFLAKNVKDYFENKVGNLLGQTKSVQISGGVDLSKFEFKERSNGFNIAFVAILSQTKNVALLLQILKMLVLKDKRYHLHVFGEFGLDFGVIPFEIPKNYMMNMIKELELENNITMYGHINNKEFNNLMKDINYIISTSYREGLTYNIAEAMAMGIKPIIHNWPGAKSNYPEKYVFNYIGEVENMLQSEYNSFEYRQYVEQNHELNLALKNMIEAVKGNDTSEYGYGAKPDLQDIFKESVKSIQAGNFDEAISGLSKIIAYDSLNYDANFNLGKIYFKLGQIKFAIQNFENCLLTKPNDRNSVVALFYALNNLNRKIEAKHILDNYMTEYENDFQVGKLYNEL